MRELVTRAGGAVPGEQLPSQGFLTSFQRMYFPRKGGVSHADNNPPQPYPRILIGVSSLRVKREAPQWLQKLSSKRQDARSVAVLQEIGSEEEPEAAVQAPLQGDKG